MNEIKEKLTKRQYEVCEMIVNGQTCPEIADKLCINLETVRTHLQNSYRRLEINRRVDLVRVWMEARINNLL